MSSKLTLALRVGSNIFIVFHLLVIFTSLHLLWSVRYFQSGCCNVCCGLVLQLKKVEEGRPVYERVVTQFPNAGRYWKLYIEHEVTILYLHISSRRTLDVGEVKSSVFCF